MLVLVDQISQLLLWGPVPKAWTTSTAHAFCSMQSCSVPGSSNILQPAAHSGQQLPGKSLRWFCCRVPLVRHFLVSSSPQHAQGWISGKFQWASFQQVPLVCVCVCILSHFSSPTLWAPMDCSPPGSSVHGILQIRILEWVAMPFSRASSPPRDQTHISCSSCIAG